MNKLFYPAISHKAEEGGFWISFPDLPECLTEGDDMAQAYEMAVEAVGSHWQIGRRKGRDSSSIRN